MPTTSGVLTILKAIFWTLCGPPHVTEHLLNFFCCGSPLKLYWSFFFHKLNCFALSQSGRVGWSVIWLLVALTLALCSPGGTHSLCVDWSNESTQQKSCTLPTHPKWVVYRLIFALINLNDPGPRGPHHHQRGSTWMYSVIKAGYHEVPCSTHPCRSLVDPTCIFEGIVGAKWSSKHDTYSSKHKD